MYGDAFTAQPFGNSLLTLTLTGAQLYALLEQQWGVAHPFPRVLQVSNGFTYAHTFPLPLNRNLDQTEGAQFRSSSTLCVEKVKWCPVRRDRRGAGLPVY
jgi:5'-nucleotidase